MSAFNLGALVIEWMDNIDLIRAKCGRMQGKEMKDRVAMIRDIIRTLVRQKPLGTLITLRSRNASSKLVVELANLKEEKEKRREEKDIKQSLIDKQRKEIRELKEMLIYKKERNREDIKDNYI